jgi:16S rRNA processing protein RimM
MEDWLRAGRVGRPHGLDGSFLVAQPVTVLLRCGAHVRVGEERRRIVRLAGHDRRVIVRLEGCDDREAADRLRGRELLVQRSEAPSLGEDEWWAADLEGCEVRDGAIVVGVVQRLLALPSCEALEVDRGTRPPLLVPLIADAVRSVDVGARRIDVDLEFLGEE